MSEQKFSTKGNLSLQPVSELSYLEHPLMAKERWDGEKDLGLRVHQHRSLRTLYFGNIHQDWFKEVAKRYVLYRRSQGMKLATLAQDVVALQTFAQFLENQCAYSFEDITEDLLSAYWGSLQHLAQTTQRTRLNSLKIFFELGTINGWFNVSTYWFREKLKQLRKNKPNKIDYIPDEVQRQLDEHLHHLPESLQRMVILLRTLGLRAVELLQMPFDCLRQLRNGQWEIHFTNWKFDEKPDIMPIIPELTDIIKEQQTYIRKHLGEFEYLFCANIHHQTGKFKLKPKVMPLGNFCTYLNRLAQQYNICDKSGQRWHFRSHQFRRTVATKMTNEGIRQYLIQCYLRHESPDMMLHYAQVFPETERKEIEALHQRKKIVDVTGTEVSINHPELDNDIGLQWLRSKMQPKALAMGFCARPELLKPCPHANACMSCEHFRLDEDDLPALKQHLERNRQLQAESKQQGYTRQLKEIEEDEVTLLILIKSLEDANA